MFNSVEMEHEGFEGVVFYFANSNIHPFREYEQRLNAFVLIAKEFELEFIIADYKPELYFREISFKEEKRCEYCYVLRVAQASSAAVLNQCDSVTTTLFASPHQDHNLIRTVAESILEDNGLEMFNWDGRKEYYNSIEIARKKDIYTQPYCGCVFSERERYDKQSKKRS